jgi:hypothetical protein
VNLESFDDSSCTTSLLGKSNSSPVLIAGVTYMAFLVAGLLLLGQVFGVYGLAVTLVIAQSIQATYLLIKFKPDKN